MAAESSNAAAARDSGPEISEDLRQLQRGAITFEAYLEGQVERAVAHLRDQVSEERLLMIRGVLREQLATSPTMAELLRRAGVPLPTAKDTR